MKYFSAMLCQNIVPQNKMKFSKKFSYRNLAGMFKLIHSVSLATDLFCPPDTEKFYKSPQADKNPR